MRSNLEKLSPNESMSEVLVRRNKAKAREKKNEKNLWVNLPVCRCLKMQDSEFGLVKSKYRSTWTRDGKQIRAANREYFSLVPTTLFSFTYSFIRLACGLVLSFCVYQLGVRLQQLNPISRRVNLSNLMFLLALFSSFIYFSFILLAIPQWNKPKCKH